MLSWHNARRLRRLHVDDESHQRTAAHYLQEIRPFLTGTPQNLSSKLFRYPRVRGRLFSVSANHHAGGSHQVLKDLEEICDERRQLAHTVETAPVAAWLVVCTRAAVDGFPGADCDSCGNFIALLATWPNTRTPLPYQARVRDTKGVAQRLDLDYLKRPNRFRDLAGS